MISNVMFPPNMTAESKVILFDGVCKLCNGWSKFIIAHDKTEIFSLASVQSTEGKKILDYFNLPTETYDTMLYIEGNTSYTQSDAFLKIIVQLDIPWKWLSIFKILPKLFRDWSYDRIALNRYKLFGKYEHCVLPTAGHKRRFLKDEH